MPSSDTESMYFGYKEYRIFLFLIIINLIDDEEGDDDDDDREIWLIAAQCKNDELDHTFNSIHSMFKLVIIFKSIAPSPL